MWEIVQTQKELKKHLLQMHLLILWKMFYSDETAQSFNVLKQYLSTGWQIEQQLSQKQKRRYGNLKLLKLLKMTEIQIIRDLFVIHVYKEISKKKLISIAEFEKEILNIQHIQLSETRDQFDEANLLFYVKWLSLCYEKK